MKKDVNIIAYRFNYGSHLAKKLVLFASMKAFWK